MRSQGSEVRFKRRGNKSPAIEGLEHRRLLAAAILKDINTDTEGSYPNSFMDAGPLYFSAATQGSGRELWKTGGTDVSTQLVADLNPGPGASNPVPLAPLGSDLVFTIDGGGVWITQGGGSGAEKLNNATPVAGTGFTESGKAYFACRTPDQHYQLWVTDGSAAGTVLLKNITPGGALNVPLLAHASLSGVAYFVADDGINGSELWRSDGTEAGTYLVKDINPVAGQSSAPASLTVMNGTLYFSAVDVNGGRGLWKSDGTSVGTSLAVPLSLVVVPANFVVVGNQLYMTAVDGMFQAGYQIYQSDGTAAGTHRVTTLGNNPQLGPIVQLNGNIIFWSVGNLWQIDNSLNGAKVVKGGQPTPAQVVTVGDVAYYVLLNNGVAVLWRTDGTADGTMQVASPQGIGTQDRPQWFALSGSTVYFTDIRPHIGYELFKIDFGGAQSELVKDINTYAPNGSDPISFKTAGNYVYFLARKEAEIFLWRTDGTEAGTIQLFDTGFGDIPVGPWDPIALGDSIVFSLAGRIWTCGPQPGSEHLLINTGGSYFVSKLVSAGDKFYFAAEAPGPISTVTLYVSDGQNLTALSSAQGDWINAMAVVGDELYFSGPGNEPWETDGTVAGTHLLKKIGGTEGSYPTLFYNVNGKFFFYADDADLKPHFWTSDGTEAGTVQLDFPLRPAFTTTDQTISAAVMGNSLYLEASNNGDSSTTGLWRTDGTAAGTVQVTPRPDGGLIRVLQELNGKIYFYANHQLYNSNGQVGNITTIAPSLNIDRSPSGYDFPGPEQLTVAAGYAYFVGGDNVRGLELCRTDGTASGTVLAYDINPGGLSSMFDFLNGITQIAALGGRVIFGATDGQRGFEVWTAGYDGEPVADAGDNYILKEGDVLTLSAAGSKAGTTADGLDTVPIVKYEWDLNFNGNVFDVDATGITTPLSGLDGPSNQVIALRITDALGRSEIDVARVHAVNTAPTLAISGDSTVDEGAAYILHLSVTDPGADIITSWQIDWGDGTFQTVAGSPQFVTHVFASGPADYLIGASAMDEDGLYDTQSLQLRSYDSSFGVGGAVEDVGSHADARMAVQADGRIVAVGGRDDFELARYLPSGALDPDFGNAGHVVRDMTSGGSERATALALLADGRILVGGFASSGTDVDWILARFMPDGSLDPDFGTGGKVLLNLGDGTGNELHDLMLLDNNQILAAGSINQGTANGGVNFAVLRFDEDGQTDLNFGTGGVVAISFGNGDDRAFGLELQSSGKIVLGGTQNYSGINSRFALVRLLPSGMLDSGPAGTPFSTGKFIPTLPQNPRSQATGMIIQKDDKIVLTGSIFGGQNAMARFMPDGALDTTFGNSSPKGYWSGNSPSGDITDSVINLEGQIFFLAPTSFNVIIGALAPDGTLDKSYFGSGSFSPSRINGIGNIAAGTLSLDSQGRPVFLTIGARGAVLFRLVAQTKDVAVTVANVAPTGADIGPNLTVGEGSTVTFTPNFSDPGVELWIYQWHVTDSLGHDVADGNTRNFSFIPPDDGVYTVQFTVSDESGSSNDVALITATNLPPVPAVSGPTSTPEGSAVTYTTRETDQGADTLTRRWSLKYPDGHTVDGGTDPTFAFTPLDNGAFVLTLAVTDDDGASASKDFPINVTNVAPTFNGNLPTGVFVDQTFNLTLSASDPGQDTVSNWLINWGDGQSVNVGPVPSISHSYSSVGPLTISITATDEDGTYPPASRTIIVSPKPISILTITGTTVADAVQITAAGDNLTVSIDGALASYPLSAYQRVDVALLDGDDTLTYSGPIPMGNVDLGNGNDTFTIDSGDVNASTTVLGGAGNDILRMNATAARVVNFQGGSGTDSLYFTATSVDDVIAMTATTTSSTGGGIINPKSVTFSTIEFREVDAGAGNDSITLLDTNSTLPNQNINGEDGDDSFIVGDPTKLSAWTGRAQFAGGNGNDSLTYNDQLNALNATYILTAAKMSGTTAPLGFDQATIELITLNTGRASDRIDVTPSSNTAMIINAGTPGNTQTPADRLGLQPSTSGATLNLTAVDSGGYQFSDGRLPVQFTGIEQLSTNDTVRPTVTSAAFSFAGTRQSFDVAFSENVQGSVDLADLQVTNLDTNQVLPATMFSLQIIGNLATPTTASWTPFSPLPDGRYRARIVAKGIADPSNNAIATDVLRDFFVFAGDADHDGTIGFSDLVAVAQNYGKTTNVNFSQGDFNYDGAVSFADLVVVAQKYGISMPSGAAAVPAPSFQFPVATSSGRADRETSQSLFSVIPVAKPIPQKAIRGVRSVHR